MFETLIFQTSYGLLLDPNCVFIRMVSDYAMDIQDVQSFELK